MYYKGKAICPKNAIFVTIAASFVSFRATKPPFF